MAKNLQVEIVSPDKRAFRGEAASVRAPGVEGSFQVLYNHAPMIAMIEAGPLVVDSAEGERITFATSGGVLEVLDNIVTVATETVEPASEIDVERARSAEEQALARLKETTDPEERKKAEAALERARNRLRVTMGQVGTE